MNLFTELSTESGDRAFPCQAASGKTQWQVGIKLAKPAVVQMKPVARLVTALGRLLGFTQSFMQQTFPFVATDGRHRRNLNVA